jgi:hypothetical protein
MMLQQSTVLFADGAVCVYPDNYGGWKRRGRSLIEYLSCDCGHLDCWVPQPVAVLSALLLADAWR